MGVIADGREQEVVVIKRPTEGSGLGIIIWMAQVILVELPEEFHVPQR